MISPQQFIDSFLKAKAAAYAEANVRLAPLFKECFGAPLSERASDFLLVDEIDVVLDDIKESADSATVKTGFPNRKDPMAHTRYHLSATDGTWRIIQLEHWCYVCLGTGSSRTGACTKCNGTGWYEYRVPRG